MSAGLCCACVLFQRLWPRKNRLAMGAAVVGQEVYVAALLLLWDQ